jgi:methyl coenzyme M reductase subunit D
MLHSPPSNPDIKRELKNQLLNMSPRGFELFAGEFLVERFRIKNYFEYNEEDDTVQIAP